MQRSQDFTFLTLVQTRSGSEGVISAIKRSDMAPLVIITN